MPTTSRFIEVLPSQLAVFAGRVRERRKERGWTQKELAERCNNTANKLYPGMGYTITDDKRITKIEMAAGQSPKGGAAKALQPWEVKVMARTLEVSTDWLVGVENEQGTIVWDPLTNPVYAEELYHLFASYERDVKELLSYGEFLPCSLETEEFMYAHNKGILQDVPGSQESKKVIIEQYNTIGNRRRKRLLDAGITRSWDFYHLMFLSDLQRIIDGRKEYKDVSKVVRRVCLQNLVNLIKDPEWKVHVIIDQDTGAESLKKLLGDCDSLIIFDDKLALWRDHWGNIYWSVNQHVVNSRRSLLEAFREAAEFRDRQSVIRVLERLYRSM